MSEEVKKAPARTKAKAAPISKKVQLSMNVKVGSKWYQAGTVIEVSEDEYQTFVEAGVLVE